MKGKLIVFEGMDCTGKSSLTKLVYDSLEFKGHDVILTTQSSKDTSLKGKIREIVLNNELDSLTQLYLFLADRSNHIQEVIKPALDSGKTVICDRYFYSTLVYQVLYPNLFKMDSDGLFDLFQKWYNLNLETCLNILPDLIIFCNAPIKNIQDRLKLREKDVIEKEIDLKHIHSIYESLLLGNKYLKNQKVKEINTGQPMELCLDQIEREILKCL